MAFVPRPGNKLETSIARVLASKRSNIPVIALDYSKINNGAQSFLVGPKVFQITLGKAEGMPLVRQGGAGGYTALDVFLRVNEAKLKNSILQQVEEFQNTYNESLRPSLIEPQKSQPNIFKVTAPQQEYYAKPSTIPQNLIVGTELRPRKLEK
jgi:hypothetical protein